MRWKTRIVLSTALAVPLLADGGAAFPSDEAMPPVGDAVEAAGDGGAIEGITLSSILVMADVPEEWWWMFGGGDGYQEVDVGRGVTLYFDDNQDVYCGSGLTACVSVKIWMKCNSSSFCGVVELVRARLDWDEDELTLVDFVAEPDCYKQNPWENVNPPGGSGNCNNDCQNESPNKCEDDPMGCGDNVEIRLEQVSGPLDDWELTGCHLVTARFLFSTENLCSCCDFYPTLSINPGDGPMVPDGCRSVIYDDEDNDITNNVDNDIQLHVRIDNGGCNPACEQ